MSGRFPFDAPAGAFALHGFVEFVGSLIISLIILRPCPPDLLLVLNRRGEGFGDQLGVEGGELLRECLSDLRLFEIFVVSFYFLIDIEYLRERSSVDVGKSCNG